MRLYRIALVLGTVTAAIAQIPASEVVHISTVPPKVSCECGLWKVSVAAMHAGVAMDIASSWRRPELTALYRSPDGTFGEKGFALRLGVPVATAVIQRIVLSRTDARWVKRTFTVLNFVAAGSSTAVAARNWRLH